LKLAVDAVFPQDTLMLALERFGRVCSQTWLQLLETTLSGTDEALFSGQVDLALSYRVPPGFVGERLLDMRFVAVAAPHHPLAA
ncbi:LysR substrate-binding domain-containing protein, partial [Escherichia coli]|uniref:LysR substrate-binding domain-containing protein n=1 Tax=Escherichia coli TaxID=562 RepID=UPI0021147494